MAAAEVRRLLEGSQARVQTGDETVCETRQRGEGTTTERALGTALRSREVEGIRATGDVDVSRRRRDREAERQRRVVVSVAAEVRGLLERGKARVQARDEPVEDAAAEGVLGPAGRAREIGGLRRARDVDVAGRRRDRERAHTFAAPTYADEAAPEVGRLLERRQAGIQARHEGVRVATQRALRSPVRAREVRGLGAPANDDVARRRIDR